MPICPMRTWAGTARAAAAWARPCCSLSCNRSDAMGLEIERKFLLRGEAWRALGKPVLLRQGYLSAQPERTVRVRVEGAQGLLTIKGKSEGATRGEWEYPIPLADAGELL